MLYSLSELTANSYKIIICDNGSNKKDIKNLKRLAEKPKNIESIYRQQTESGSIAHAEALDILIEKVDTKYTVVMDSDCVFLLKNWDEILIKNINETIKITGSTSPANRKGNRIGGGCFPLPFAVLFETEIYKKLNISCMPRNIKEGEDTCWQWKPMFTQAGFSGKTLTEKNTRDFKDGMFGDLTGIANFFTDSGELIASHFGRGSSGGAAKYLKWLKVPVISRYIKRYFGNIEKKKWITKCYKIIDNQY